MEEESLITFGFELTFPEFVKGSETLETCLLSYLGGSWKFSLAP